MEAKNINQSENGVFFNTLENQATFTLEICGKDDYFETVRYLLDLLGSVEEEFCDRNSRYYICKLIKSMLPNEKQVHNIGEMDSLKNDLQDCENKIQMKDEHIEANIKLIKSLQGRD